MLRFVPFSTHQKCLPRFIFSKADSGALPDVVPYYHHGGEPGDPAWTTAYVLIVSWMWEYFGDTRIATDNYDHMKEFLSSIGKQVQSDGLWNATYARYGISKNCKDVSFDCFSCVFAF